MPLNEVFPKPTVDRIVFQIRYPHLFFLEQRIGDLQLKLMRHFPESDLLFQRNFVVVQQAESEQPAPTAPEQSTTKIWRFKNGPEVILDIQTDSMTLVTKRHTSYRLAAEPLRDLLASAILSFLEVTGLPTITRLGLRYVDICPLPNRDATTLSAWYAAVMCNHRFPLEDCDELMFRAAINRGNNKLRYIESIGVRNDEPVVILDFDAWTGSLNAADIMNTTDALHDSILREFELTAREPLLTWMRTP